MLVAMGADFKEIFVPKEQPRVRRLPHSRVSLGRWDPQTLAVTPDRQRGESEQQRNLRIRTRAEQFIVGWDPAVLQAAEQRDAFLAPAHDDTADAALEFPREPPVRHRAQQFFFGLSPRPASGVKQRNVQLSPTQADGPQGPDPDVAPNPGRSSCPTAVLRRRSTQIRVAWRGFTPMEY